MLLACPSLGAARPYTIGIVEWEPWAIAWIAGEKGFWQQEGIEVEVKQFSEYENGCVRAFKFGKVDFALMMLGTAVELINLAPRYLILHEHDWSHGGDYFIVDNNINGVEGLRGKKIGLYSHSLPLEFFVEKILQSGGLCTRSGNVRIYEVSNTRKLNTALVRGTFSAIVNYGADAMEIIRQGKDSSIIPAAHALINGEMPAIDNDPDGDLFFVEEKDSQKASEKIVDLLTRRLPAYYKIDPADIQVLTPMHKGFIGTQELNERVRAVLNPDAGEGFQPGDRVM